MLRRNNAVTLVIIFLSVMLIGTIGYSVLLDISFIDALYMTIITVTTVGFGEVVPLTEAAKVFTIILLLLSVGVIGYTITSIASIFVEGGMQRAWRRRMMERNMAKLKDHYILCGASDSGQYVIEELLEEGVPIIVIDHDEQIVEELRKRDIMAILGDATEEETLLSANVKSARGLVSVLPRDSENILIVLTARELNPQLYIVVQSSNPANVKKIMKAGANNTVSPSQIGGTRMAAMVLKPSVVSFLDMITKAGEIELDLEDIKLTKDSNLVGQNLIQARIPERTGLIILAVQHANGETEFNPPPKIVLQTGDTLIVLGRQNKIENLRAIAGIVAPR